MMIRVAGLCCLILIFLIEARGDGLVEVFRWKQMDYYNCGGGGGNDITSRINVENTSLNNTPGIIHFPEDNGNVRNKRNAASTNGNSTECVPYNNVPMGVTHFKDRLFITVPRRRPGIPSTLNYIDLRKDGNEESPKLHAYPDFETNQLGQNINNLISVYRTHLDACGRLWFIDIGYLEYPDNLIQLHRPTIWIIDLANDKLVRRVVIPATIVEQGNGLASLAVDTDKGCDQAFAYIPDLLNNALHVYSFAADRMWSFDHNYFHFDPLAGEMFIGGQRFSWRDGIFSIVLGPTEYDGSRNILFHAMASNNEFVVSNRILQNEGNSKRSHHGNDFRWLGNRGPYRQSTMHAYDPRTGVLFYAEIQRNGVGCWNTNTRFSPDNHGTVAQDAQRMIYPSDLTIDDDGVLWLMTNSMPIFIYSTLDTNIYNFRVWRQTTQAAANGTACA